MPATPDPPLSGRSDPHSEDDALVAELTAPPTLEEARESHDYWRRRLADLPRHRRSERKEATEMVARAKERLEAAERRHYGPGAVEQLLEALGIRWRPNLRRLIIRFGVVATLLMIVLVVAIVAVIAYWPDLQPIVRTLLGDGGDG